MTIEIAPKEYWLCNVSWHDASLYCLMLRVDNTIHWRLPSIQDVYSTDIKLMLETARDEAITDESVWIWTSDNVLGYGTDRAYQVDLFDLESCWYPSDSEHYVLTLPVRDVC